MKIELPRKVSFIISNLSLHGYEAYAVGGCVRDAILAKEPKDWDITTSATPAEIKGLFRHTIDTGIEHGTVTVLLGKEAFEVTTYRIDGTYEDGRHPTSVTFTTSLEEDLKRRDFTINAMAYSPDTRLVDKVGGMKDLNHHLIRCVGDPKTRFTEDYLRILRGIRFSAQLGFKLEEHTKEGMVELAPNLSKISAERVRDELVKLLISKHPEKIHEAYELGITKIILPEWDAMVGVEQKNPHHSYDVAHHTILALKAVANDKILRLTMLFHDMGKPYTKTTDSKGIDHFIGHDQAGENIAREVMNRLKFDKETIGKVTKLVAFHDYPMNTTGRAVRRAINRIGVDLFPYYLAVRLADIKAQSNHERKEKLKKVIQVRELYRKILQENQCVSLKELAITGRDLIELGMVSGPGIGEVLNEVLEFVMDHPEYNTREYLLPFSEKLVKKLGGSKWTQN
jgi:tRNA nucleotidyltransferase (CCA-adding enzyme)